MMHHAHQCKCRGCYFFFNMAVALEIEFEHSRGNFHYFIDSSCFLDYSNKQLTLMLILFAQFILSL